MHRWARALAQLLYEADRWARRLQTPPCEPAFRQASQCWTRLTGVAVHDGCSQASTGPKVRNMRSMRTNGATFRRLVPLTLLEVRMNTAKWVVTMACLVVATAACKKDEEPAPAAANTQYQQQPVQGQQGYQQPQQGYPQPQQGSPQPAQQQPAQQAPVAAAPTGTLAVPGPLALPCSSDSQCTTAKCNTQYGKCVFPCATDFDCNPGNSCVKGLVPACMPKFGN